MKTNLTFRSLFSAFLMVVFIFTTSFATVAQQKSVEVQAKLDAEADLNRWAWRIYGFAGCLGVILTTAAGAFVGLTTEDGFLEFDNMMYGGCCGLGGGLLVVTLPILNEPKVTPPPERFIGKSPEYVDVYTDVYKAKTRQLRIKSAAAGFAIGSGALLITSTVVGFIVDDQ